MASFVGDLEHIRELLDNLKVSCEETNQDEAVSALEEADAVLSGISFEDGGIETEEL